MQLNHYERLQKMKCMALRCRGALGNDFEVVMDILDEHIRINRYPTQSQKRLRGQIDAICGM